jgi:RNA polymerase sigma-70 factor (ECF subfamily)
MQRDEILSRLRERILGFAASQLSRDAAEDVVQEVMLLLHTKYAQVEAIEELVPLSLRITRFKIAGLRRKTHRRGEDTQLSVDDLPLADPGADPEECAERRELLERLSAALRRLGPRCREMFRLKLQGKSFSEIQRILGAGSINTVYTWDFRCRKELLDLMGGDGEAGQ